jgi:hypothetical protein
MQNNSEYIKKLYEKNTYISKYGGSLFLTITILLIFIVLIIKNSLSGYFKSLKKNWKEVRCNPLLMPFAGMINAPSDESKVQFTVDNFGHCLTNILKDVTEVETEAIKKTSVRDSAGGLFKTSQSKLFNISAPIRGMLINTKAFVNKMQGVMTSSLYTNMGVNISTRSFMFGFKIALIIFLIFIIFFIAIAIVVALAIMFIFLPITFFIGWNKLGPVLSYLFYLIFEGIGVIADSIGIAGNVIYLTSNDRLCFDGNTLIDVKNKGKIKIKDIKINDELVGSGKVTATFKVANHNQEIYKINNVIVTGKHLIEMEDDSVIEVKDHYNSKKIKDYREPYLYCLNTTSKKININDISFLDWDEIDADDLSKLKERVSDIKLSNTCIHKYLDVGIDGNTNIELEDGRSILLKNIQVNDQLKNGERVLGIVRVDSNNINDILKYKIGNTPIICTPNNKINIKDLGNISLFNIYGEKIKHNVELYQLITDTKTYTINGVKFLDYNGGLEPTLWRNDYPNEIY